jgi:uncharacterized protein
MDGPALEVGVISDTHGLLRPEALAALAGVVRIVHAGDIGALEVLNTLATIAPVTAVRGNNDRGAWARELPETALVEVGGISIYLLHDLNTLSIDPVAAGVSVVVSGHSHKPAQAESQGVLYLNPGSAGPRRFKLPIAVGRLSIEGGRVSAELHMLDAT